MDEHAKIDLIVTDADVEHEVKPHHEARRNTALLDEHPGPVFVIPGEPEEVAREIAEVGVEGRPADAKAGPALLWTELAGLVLILTAVAVGFGIWLGWEVGVMALALLLFSLIVNSVVGATILRARDRAIVAERHQHNHATEYPPPV